MSAPKLTVREVVAVLRRARWHLKKTSLLGGDIAAILARWDAEVEAEEREEHRRTLEDAERNVVEPW